MAARRSKDQDSQSPPRDQRSGQRFTLLLRAAKLVTKAGEFLCLLRDVSDHGLKAQLFHDLEIDADCAVELGNGERLALKCVWQRERKAGFRFAEGPIEANQLIDESGPFPKRNLRVRLNPSPPLLLTIDGLNEPGQLCDISQHGAAVTIERRLALGAQVRLAGSQLPALHARVCWRNRGMHGLVFQQGFRLDELAELAWRLQVPAAKAGNPPKTMGALTTD
jgi:hypothetical protein